MYTILSTQATNPSFASPAARRLPEKRKFAIMKERIPEKNLISVNFVVPLSGRLEEFIKITSFLFLVFYSLFFTSKQSKVKSAIT